MLGVSLTETVKISNIIDDLYREKEANNKLRKSVVFIVGNGIYPVNNILNDKSRNKIAKKKNIKLNLKEDRYQFKWHLFQYAKYYTENYMPSFSHFFIFQLLNDGICKNVITTNYDMYFDSIWNKNPTLKILQNPILSKQEYDWEGYYSSKSQKKDAAYWKIHGSLSHVIFKQKKLTEHKYIFKLPRFIVSSNSPTIQKTFRIERLLPCLDYEQKVFPNTMFNCNHKEYRKRFEPYIDWVFNNDRVLFKNEIQRALKILKKPSSIAAIILVGLSGFHSPTSHPWNEELVEELSGLHRNGFDKIFMAVHEKQFLKINGRNYGFMKKMYLDNKCWVYKETSDFINGILSYSNKMRYSEFNDNYKKWQRWYLAGKELQPSGRK